MMLMRIGVFKNVTEQKCIFKIKTELVPNKSLYLYSFVRCNSVWFFQLHCAESIEIRLSCT